MNGFIHRLAGELTGRKDWAGLTVVFPNKRPAAFLARELTRRTPGAVLLPEMISVSDFLQRQTPYIKAEKFESLLDLYEAYQDLARQAGYGAQSLEQFLGWAPVLLADFDEIDKFLVPPGEILGNVAAIKEMETWAENMEAATETSDYIRFFRSLPELYKRFHSILSAKGAAYEGMIYRYAARHVEQWAAGLEPQSIVLAGFNALTPAEHRIFGHLVRSGKAVVRWDIHRFYLEEPFEAGRFLRRLRQDPVLGPTFPDRIPEGFPAGSTHRFVETPGLQSQFQWLARELEKLPPGTDWLRVAVVLPDAQALLPLLHSLPDLPAVNITFGLSLRELPPVQWWMHYLQWLRRREENRPVDVLELAEFFENQYALAASDATSAELAAGLRQSPVRFIPWDKIPQTWQSQPGWQSFFGPQTMEHVLENGLLLIQALLDHQGSSTDKAAILELRDLWEGLLEYRRRFNWFDNIRSLEKILLRLLDAQSLAFEGHPLKGLQVMGLLETRLLDFDRVYVLAANEGLLPSATRTESFLPADLRRHFKLPLNEDKNAIAAYHFYRLAASARECTYLYSSSGSGFTTGEPSRFVEQLRFKLPGKAVEIRQHQVQAGIGLHQPATSLPKDPKALERLREKILQNAVSPSFLTSYLHYPADFYRRYVLGWPDDSKPEAFVAANMMGTVIHNAMEELYRPFVGSRITDGLIGKLSGKAGPLVERIFRDEYLEKTGHHPTGLYGKNLLAVKAAGQTVRKFLMTDKELAGRETLVIEALEQRISPNENNPGQYPAFVDVPGVGRIYFHGILDRLDRSGNTWRLVDYKTGDAKSPSEKRFRKALDDGKPAGEYFRKKTYKYFLQLWMYVWMARRQGILPPQAGVQPVIYTPRQAAPVVFPVYTPSDDILLEAFLRELMAEIFNPAVPFSLEQ